MLSDCVSCALFSASTTTFEISFSDSSDTRQVMVGDDG